IVTTTTVPGSTTSTTLPGCGPSPQDGCRTPRSSRLRIRAGASPAGDRVDWAWTRGAETTLADFGDPTTTTGYRLCVYDHAATTPSLVAEAAVPAGGTCEDNPCWRRRHAGFRFRSAGTASDGIVQVDLVPGRRGRAAIAVKGRGPSLPAPALPLA